LVSRVAVALVARLAYNEPYRTLRMRSVTPRGLTEAPGRLQYQWRIRGTWEGLAATAGGGPAGAGGRCGAAVSAPHPSGLPHSAPREFPGKARGGPAGDGGRAAAVARVGRR